MLDPTPAPLLSPLAPVATGAAPACLVTMVAMGLTISAASLTGMTINPIDKMRMQGFGIANTSYVEKRITAARQAAQIVIVVESAFDQIKASSTCERQKSCVSRVGNGGEGLTYFTLKSAETLIGIILQKLKDGNDNRDETLQKIEEAQEHVLTTLNAANPLLLRDC